MNYASPLRYPGGKACLSDFLAEVIEINCLRDCAYYEPFAGGAGAALSLLSRKIVSVLHLNDVDPRVYAFWRSALHATNRFVDKILNTPLTIKEWHRQHEICSTPNSYSLFEVGFAAFFMNRCNRSGVITRAGPIGGYKQKGKWRMNARFNRKRLADRIQALARLKSSIQITRLDAIDFLKEKLPKGRARRGVLAYLDPPYVIKGQRLYLNAYEQRDHALLAHYLKEQNTLPWIMSYDDSKLIRDLYKDCSMAMLPIKYSLQSKRASHELLIAPNRLSVPFKCCVQGVQKILQIA